MNENTTNLNVDINFLENEHAMELFKKMVKQTNFKIMVDILNNDVTNFLEKVIDHYKKVHSDWKIIFAKGEIKAYKEYVASQNNKNIKDNTYISKLVLQQPSELKKFLKMDEKDDLTNVNVNNISITNLGYFEPNNLDLAGKLNIIQYRFYTDNTVIKDLCQTIRNYRISFIGHQEQDFVKRVNSLRKFYDNINHEKYFLSYNGLCKKVGNINKGTSPKEIAGFAKELLNNLVLRKKVEDLIKDGITIDWDNDKPFRFEYFTKYNIFFTPTALVTPIAHEAAQTMFIGICDFTRNINVKYDDGEKYGVNFFKEDYLLFENYIGSGSKRGARFSGAVDTNSDVIRIVTAEKEHSIEDFFQDKEENYCIITESDDTAAKIKSLGKKNVIAACIYDGNRLCIYSNPKEKTDLKTYNREIKEREYVSIQMDAINKHRYGGDEEEITEFVKPREVPKEGSKVKIKYVKSEGQTNLGSVIGGGGEGKIYSISDEPNECIKIYDGESWKYDTLEKVSAMINDNESLKFDEKAHICWPKELVIFKEDYYVGFTMDKVPSGARTISSIIDNISRNEWQLQRIDLVEICKKIIYQFRCLHNAGLLMGDVNLKNIMISKGEAPHEFEAYFIDVDSYQYKDFLCNTGVDDFASKRILEEQQMKDTGFRIKREIEDEYFAEAMLIFEVLFLGDYPYKIEGDVVSEIIRGKYRFAKNVFRNDHFAKDKYNYIYHNLTYEMQVMFENIFTHNEKAKKYDDDEFLNLLSGLASKINVYISDDIDEDWEDKIDKNLFLSNQIEPTAMCEDFKWKRVCCRSCRKEFWTAPTEKDSDKCPDKCPDCLEQRDYERTIIYECVCSKCNQPFISNYYNLKDDGVISIGKNGEINKPEELLCYNCRDEAFIVDDEEKYFSDDNNLKQLNFALEKYYRYRYENGPKLITNEEIEE